MAISVSAREIGRRVSVLRHARLMRQCDLAKAAGVARQTVTEIEAGRNASVRTIQSIAAALGVELGDLLNEALPRLPNGR